MCTIAGYVGEKDAAPILIEMMKTLEGLDSGFFTGIATVHEGKLYCEKVIGDLDHLLKTTNTASLPGKIGIIHSRTGGEGSVERGHPFIARKNGTPVLAHVSNGGAGHFADKFEEIGRIAEKMLEEGYELRSKERFKNPKITVSDGDCIHLSDLTAQYTMKLIEQGLSPECAAETAIMTIPSDDVDLNISLYHPDSIVLAKMSQPMADGFCSHGAYMATSALAFPEDAREPIILPGFTAGKVYADRYCLKPFDTLPCTHECFDTYTVTKAYGMVAEMLKQKPMPVCDIRAELRPKLFPNAQSAPTTLVIYEVLRAMKKEGILHREDGTVPGRDGMTAPRAYFHID